MIRILFTYVVPMVLPTVIYMAWVWYARRKHGGDGDPPALRRGPLFWCLLSGFLLMSAGLVTIALMTGHPPDSGVYHSPRLKDGKIVPPHFERTPDGK